MIAGNPAVFALESGISRAFDRRSLLALGYFVIHVNARRYGILAPEATMLANSLDEVKSRIRNRGTHIARFANEPDAGTIANAFRDVIYNEDANERYFGMPLNEVAEAFMATNIQWAPDGDEAFDDGSYVLQFDLNDQVRLIAFRYGDDGRHDPSTLSDLWIAADDFYRVLLEWSERFSEEWESMTKES